MGAKKKVQVQQAPPPLPVEKIVHNMHTFRTSDGLEFKLTEEQIVKYSPKLKNLAENSNNEAVLLDDIDSKLFEIVFEYLSIHKEKEPTKIAVPMKTNQSLRYIMEQADAELIDRTVERGDNFILRLLDLTQYLEIDSLRRRVACGVALKLMKSTLEELKEQYELDQENVNEDELKSQIRPAIDALRLIPDEDPQ